MTCSTAVPELIHSTFYLKGISITPLAAVTNFGDIIILRDVVDDFRAESLVRAMACVSGDEISVCDHPMNVFALPAPEIWTTEKGLSIFGPRYFGIDTDYIPFSQRKR